jgi:hypothetical protein
MKRKKVKALPSVIIGHLSGIKRALLEGEKRPTFLEFLNTELKSKRGIYTLYNKKGLLYYTGKATDLSKRLNQHLSDRHGESWVRMALFLVADSVNVAELEGLVVATAKPPGNKQKPRIGQDLRKRLRRYLRQDAVLQIDQAIYPEVQRSTDTLSRRITGKKLQSVSQLQIARVLGVSQPRVSQLFRNGKMRKYILEAGKRDAVLLLLQKAKKH